MIRTAAEAFADLKAATLTSTGVEVDVEVEVREARVHLWYEQEFGGTCAPHTCTEAAIDSFAATTCCPGVRLEPDGRWCVCAPHGLAAVFNMVVRPNPMLAPRAAYEAKSARWRQQWPELTVLDGPSV